MKSVLKVISLLAYCSAASFSQTVWTKVSTGSAKSLAGIRFRTPNDGWAVGSKGVIVHTTDGGTTWTEDSVEWNNRKPTLWFVELQDSLNIWTGRWGDPWYRSTDGGATWNSLWIDSVGSTSRIFFIRPDVAFACGYENLDDYSGRILRSSDGGMTWKVALDTAHRAFYDVGFADTLFGLAVGSTSPAFDNFDAGVIFRTTDGGQTWSEVLNLGSGPFDRVTLMSKDTAWVGGENGRVFLTTDGGTTWNPKSPPLSAVWISSVAIQGGQRVWITPYLSSSIYFTDDLGDSWSSLGIPQGGRVSGLHFIDQNTGWAAGDSGYVWRFNLATKVSLASNGWPRSGLNVHPNYPNPFNPRTSIRFSLDAPSFMKLRVFDVLGKQIVTITEREYESGEHKVFFDGDGLPSGMYIYVLQAADQVIAGKMILSK